MKKLNMKSAIKQYNSIMESIGHKNLIIDTRLLENTDYWNLRHMVEEADYVLSKFYEKEADFVLSICHEKGNCNEALRTSEEVQMWRSHSKKLQCFIHEYEPYIKDMVKNMRNNKKYNYQFMQKDTVTGKYIPDMAKLKANASCKEEIDYITAMELRWEEYRKKGNENLIGFDFNMCYVMKQACGHFEIFQRNAKNETDVITWLSIVEEEMTKYRDCTCCVLG